MPIRPENKALYPAKRKEISRAIRHDRAGHAMGEESGGGVGVLRGRATMQRLIISEDRADFERRVQTLLDQGWVLAKGAPVITPRHFAVILEQNPFAFTSEDSTPLSEPYRASPEVLDIILGLNQQE